MMQSARETELTAIRDGAPPVGRTRLGRPQKIMLGGLCVMYMITYIDRVNISTAAPFIQKDLGLSAVELGLVFSAFAIPYGFLQPLGGFLGDRYGPRWVLFLAGALWSAATACTGLATGLVSLIWARFGLGLGEGATFPTATKAMASWLPANRRGLAQGSPTPSRVSATRSRRRIVGYLILAAGWRVPFYVLGGISLIWVVWWFGYFRDDPRRHRSMAACDTTGLPMAAAAAAQGPGALAEAGAADPAGLDRGFLLRLDALGVPHLAALLPGQELPSADQAVRVVLGLHPVRGRHRRHGGRRRLRHHPEPHRQHHDRAALQPHRRAARVVRLPSALPVRA